MTTQRANIYRPVTVHVIDRIAERCNPNEGAAILRVAIEYAADHPIGDHAVRIADLGQLRGTYFGEESNGDTVWAIIRNGRIITIMFRRSIQPTTPAAFKVEYVAIAA